MGVYTGLRLRLCAYLFWFLLDILVQERTRTQGSSENREDATNHSVGKIIVTHNGPRYNLVIEQDRFN